jgi:hypothetical protein
MSAALHPAYMSKPALMRLPCGIAAIFDLYQTVRKQADFITIPI